MPALDCASQPDALLSPMFDWGCAKIHARSDASAADFFARFKLMDNGINRETETAGLALAGLAPGEWLVTGPLAGIAEIVELGRAAMEAGLVVDLSHARVIFLLSGEGATSRLSAHCPLDLSSEVFGAGRCARTLLGQAGLFVSRVNSPLGNGFRLIVDQTMAQYASNLLMSGQ